MVPKRGKGSRSIKSKKTISSQGEESTGGAEEQVSSSRPTMQNNDQGQVTPMERATKPVKFQVTPKTEHDETAGSSSSTLAGPSSMQPQKGKRYKLRNSRSDSDEDVTTEEEDGQNEKIIAARKKLKFDENDKRQHEASDSEESSGSVTILGDDESSNGPARTLGGPKRASAPIRRRSSRPSNPVKMFQAATGSSDTQSTFAASSRKFDESLKRRFYACVEDIKDDFKGKGLPLFNLGWAEKLLHEMSVEDDNLQKYKPEIVIQWMNENPTVFTPEVILMLENYGK